MLFTWEAYCKWLRFMNIDDGVCKYSPYIKSGSLPVFLTTSLGGQDIAEVLGSSTSPVLLDQVGIC